MKYLLSYLETLPNAPKVEQPGFQQLLADVQAGKSQARSSDLFYENLEKIVNELKSSPESAAFQKPVSKRDAPDYLDYITKPMDLSTVLRNVKQKKYKTKADFAADLDLIWANCHMYNTQETHPLRAAARFMQQKTNYHLEFLVDRTERAPVARIVSRPVSTPTVLPTPKESPGEEDDAAGESDAGPSVRRESEQRERPKADTLEHIPALIRNPQSLTRLSSISLAHPFDKGKGKEVLQGVAPPAWYDGDDEEGSWWGVVSKDESYVGGLPAVPSMASGSTRRRKRIKPPSTSLGKIIHQTIDQLSDARRMTYRIQEWQRIDAEGGIQPPEEEQPENDKHERKRKRREERVEVLKRRKMGGEIGEEEAVMGMKGASASLLALAGFEGANEIALDMFSRVAIDNLRNLGKTFRLLLDDFSRTKTPEEIVLHALNENGQVRPEDLEGYIKEGIEKTHSKVSEMTRKVKQAYQEVTTAPVIDEMMFNENGEMFLDGNFAEELGEDFLGLRDLGIEKEFGMASLSVPSSLFYGRRKRQDVGIKADMPDYPPPPPFVPLTQLSQLPAILHGFFASLLEKGLQDDEFDPAKAQIGPLGQVLTKNPAPVVGKKREVKKLSTRKVNQPGVGKGNWIRPSKEERERKAAEKRAALAKAEDVGEEDAEGEEE